MSPLLRFLLAVLGLLTLARWAAAATWEITPQEAYLYQLMNRRVLVGCDGGGLAAMFASGAMWFGKTSLALRFFTPLLAASASIILFRLLLSLASERGAAWGVVVLNLLPSFNVGAIQLRPEWVAAYFALGGLALLWKALHKSGKWDWRWPATGLLWGLALLSHPSALLLPLGFLLLLLISRRWRGRLRSPGPWLLLAVWFLTSLLPLLLWNQNHAGVMLDLWLEKFGWRNEGLLHFSSAWELLIQAAAGLSPLLLLGAGWAVWKTLRAEQRDDASYFLIAFSFPGIGLGFVGGMLGLGNFAMLVTTIPVLVCLMIHHWQPRSALRDRQSRWQWSALAVAVLTTLLTLNTDLLRRARLVSSYGWDPSREMLGWSTTARQAAQLISEASAETPEGLMVIAETPELAAALDFHLEPDVFVLRPDANWPRVQILESPVISSQYGFWPRYDVEAAEGTDAPPPVLLGKSALFFTDINDREGPPTMITHTFGSVEPMMVYEVRRQGRLIRTLRFFLCRDYQGSPM